MTICRSYDNLDIRFLSSKIIVNKSLIRELTRGAYDKLRGIFSTLIPELGNSSVGK